MTDDALRTIREEITHECLFSDDPAKSLPAEAARMGAVHGESGAEAAGRALTRLGFHPDEVGMRDRTATRLYGRMKSSGICEWVAVQYVTDGPPVGGISERGAFQPMKDVTVVPMPEARCEYLAHGTRLPSRQFPPTL